MQPLKRSIEFPHFQWSSMEKSINFVLFKPSVDYKIIHNLMIPPEIISSQRQELYANITEDSYIHNKKSKTKWKKKSLYRMKTKSPQLPNHYFPIWLQTIHVNFWLLTHQMMMSDQFMSQLKEIVFCFAFCWELLCFFRRRIKKK